MLHAPYSEKIAIQQFPICPHPAWIEIDTEQFRKNLRAICKIVAPSKICLPLKANAYGHGLVKMAKIAEEVGIETLGVSCLKEGVELRLNGIELPIVIFGAIHESQITDLIHYDLQFSISSKYKAELVAKRCSVKCKVHLEIDTGMRRTGVRVENALDLLSFVESFSCFDVVGIYSHMATSDKPQDLFAKEQIAAFSKLKEKLQDRSILFHLANSGGIVHYPDSYFDMVRPGLLCYGYFPDGRWDDEIKPVLSLKAHISYFKVVAKGVGISYGHTYHTEKTSRIVTIPVGYGDGFRRDIKTDVLIRGKKYPIAGAICMDQFMVDIGEDAGYVGDEAVLIGKQGEEEIFLWDLAKSAGTIAHEILTGFNDRLPRIYL